MQSYEVCVHLPASRRLVRQFGNGGIMVKDAPAIHFLKALGGGAAVCHRPGRNTNKRSCVSVTKEGLQNVGKRTWRKSSNENISLEMDIKMSKCYFW